MTKFSIRTASCATALFVAAPALADVTAAQVWEEWQQMMETGGDVVVEMASETVDTDRVVVEGAVYTYPTEQGETVVTIDRIELSGNGDGTVTLTTSDTVPVVIDDTDGSRVELSVVQSGARTIVSGTPEALNFAVSADRYAIRTDRVLSADGQPQDVSVLVAMNGVSGGYDQTTGALRDFDYAMTADSLDLLADFTDPETGEDITLSGKIDALALDADIAVPDGVDASDLEALIAAGFAITAGYDYAGAAYIFAMNGEGTTGDGTATTGPGSLRFGMSRDGLSYATDVQDLSAQVQGTELPFPVRLSAESYGTGVTIPLVPTPAPVPFGVRLGLTDLTVGDEVWSMIDPQGKVPRDPASLNIDVSGEALLEQSLFTEFDGSEDGEAPGEVTSVSINDISLTLAGAALKAVGAFAFDPDGVSATPGMGTPSGQITVDMTGANQLIDTAIAMGLVPADQAMMGRMMLGMFAKPVGDDALQVVIEVTPDGRVLANGQPIP